MQIVLDFERDGEPSDVELEGAGERADIIKFLFAELYTNYHAYRQFAEEVLGVNLETWFTLHHHGEALLTDIESLLDDQMRHDLAEELLNENNGPDGTV